MKVNDTKNTGDHDRNFKQESRRNKKLRFRKSDKRHRAELIAASARENYLTRANRHSIFFA
jgi:hypothetical protein